MKIKEIIELSKTDSLAKIAKEHLSVGKEKARAGLKKAGCYSINGLKGWHFEGDESVLEQSIYDFVSTTRKAKPSPNVSNKRNKSVESIKSNISKERANTEIEETKKQLAPTLERKKVSSNVKNDTNVNSDVDVNNNTDVNFDTNVGIKVGTGTDSSTNSITDSNSLIDTDNATNIDANTNIGAGITRKRASFDLDVQLVKELKIQSVIQDKNLYEMVEIAIRHYLNNLK